MRTIIAMCLFFWPTSFSTLINKEDAKKIDKIVIRCTDISTLTEISVDCNRFESAFPNSVKAYEFKDPKTLRKIISYLNEARKDTSSEAINFDIRAKIILVYKAKSDTLCLDRLDKFGFSGEAWNLPENSRIVNFVDSLYYTR